MKSTAIKAGLLASCAGEVVEPPLPSFPSNCTEEESTQPDTETETETEAQTAPEDAGNDRILQVPLVYTYDTDSFITLPDCSSGGAAEMVFHVPNDQGELIPAYTISIAPDLVSVSESNTDPNLQINLYVIKSHNLQYEDFPFEIIYICEYTYINPEDGSRYFGAECSSLMFSDRSHQNYLSKELYCSRKMSYTDATKAETIQNRLAYMRQFISSASRLNARCANALGMSNRYDLTLLYSYENGVETISQPITELPSMELELTYEYAYHEQGE